MAVIATKSVGCYYKFVLSSYDRFLRKMAYRQVQIFILHWFYYDLESDLHWCHLRYQVFYKTLYFDLLFNYPKADDKILVCKFPKNLKSKLYQIENTKTRGQIV